MYIIVIMFLLLFPYQAISASSVTSYGITWTFTEDKTVGQYANGDYWVIGPVTLSSISPSPSYVGGRYKNGSMVNIDVNVQEQGFDSNLPVYNQTLNVGYNNLGNMSLTSGNSLVSAVSQETEGSLKRWVSIYAVLTVVSSAPPSDSFRPSYLNTSKAMPYTYSNVDTSKLLSLTPTSNMPAWSEAEKRILPIQPYFIWYYYGSWILPIGIGSEYLPSYGREISRDVGVIALMLNTDSTNSEKRSSLIGIIQRGLDDYATYRAYRIENDLTFPWHPDGGIKNGHKLPILLAGYFLNDSAMKAIGFIPEKFHEDGQTFYVTQTEVDLTNSGSWNPDERDPTQPYSASHIGMPEWGLQHNIQPTVDNAHWDANYRRSSNSVANSGTALAALAMGLKSSWNHNPYFDYQRRYMAIENGDADPFGYTGVDGAPITLPGWRSSNSYWDGAGTWMTAMYDQYFEYYYQLTRGTKYKNVKSITQENP